MRFEDSIYLWLLWVVPILAFIRLVVWRQRHNKFKKFGDPQLLKLLMPDASPYRPTVKFWLCLAALSLLIIVLARPQMGSKVSQEKRNGIELIIAMDISNSMKAQDVVPSRLDKAKFMVESLVDNFNNDKVGLVVFAGDAFVQLPITSDYVSAKMFLQNISPSLINTQGTDIAKAIDISMHSFTQQEKVGKAIILITDGENHEDDAVGAAKLAHEQGVTVHVVGMGTPDGTPIPVNGTMSFRKDRDGNVVVTKLDEEMCRRIAAAGSGVYVRADNSSAALNVLSEQIDKMQKGDLETKSYAEYDEKFYIFVWIALFLVIAEYFVFNRQNKQLNKINWFD